MRISLDDIHQAAKAVYASMSPTPQYCWPLLSQHLGAQVWAKHENHTPVGAFKIRGGLAYFAQNAEMETFRKGVISATRGNHGQSLGFAARKYDIPATVVVPEGNSVEKNAAMQALGVELVVHGADFQASREYAAHLAEKRRLHFVPSYHPTLIAGVATYALELFQHAPDLDVVYVPIGLGSGVSGLVTVRDALGLKTQIVGVVSSHAPAYAESFARGTCIDGDVTTQLADGMACRSPEPEALEVILNGVDRIVQVSDDAVAEAMRLIFSHTHNVAEGAGAAGLAAAIQERAQIAGKSIAFVLSGGNVDRKVFASVLQAES